MSDISDIDPIHELEAGMVLGIHNMYIVIPQFISTFLSSLVFAVLKDTKFDSFAIVLALGGIASVFAGIMVFRLTDEERKNS